MGLRWGWAVSCSPAPLGTLPTPRGVVGRTEQNQAVSDRFDDELPPRRGMPPFGWVGAVVPWFAALAQSPTAFVVLHDVTAYPHGLTFELRMNALNEEQALGDDPPFGAIEEGLSLMVVFSDGRIATQNSKWDYEFRLAAPVVQVREGSGRSGHGKFERDLKGWLWPIPPPGPTRWILEVPKLSLRSVTIFDAAQVQAALAKSYRAIAEPPGAG